MHRLHYHELHQRRQVGKQQKCLPHHQCYQALSSSGNGLFCSSWETNISYKTLQATSVLAVCVRACVHVCTLGSLFYSRWCFFLTFACFLFCLLFLITESWDIHRARKKTRGTTNSLEITKPSEGKRMQRCLDYKLFLSISKASLVGEMRSGWWWWGDLCEHCLNLDRPTPFDPLRGSSMAEFHCGWPNLAWLASSGICYSWEAGLVQGVWVNCNLSLEAQGHIHILRTKHKEQTPRTVLSQKSSRIVQHPSLGPSWMCCLSPLFSERTLKLHSL